MARRDIRINSKGFILVFVNHIKSVESVETKQSGVINVLQSYGILDGDCRFMTLSGLKEEIFYVIMSNNVVQR